MLRHKAIKNTMPGLNMPLYIPNNHPTIVLSGKLNEICQFFLNQHGLNYFQYLRCYEDGSIGLLHNNNSLLRHFAELDFPIFSSYNYEHKSLHSYYFLWDEELPYFPVYLARKYHNIHHGITFVRRTKDYYDMIAFGMPEERSNAASYYLTRLKAMEEFIIHFDCNNKDLIVTMGQNPIALPELNRDKNYKELCLQSSRHRFSVTGKWGDTYITPQELSCLKLLLQGYSYKEIGSQLVLSPRTIETYITRVKTRTGINGHREFKKLLSLCP